MKSKHIFGILFCSALILFGYCLTVFTDLAKIDQQFEINTRFKDSDLQNWLAPQRATPLITRWCENRSSEIKPHYVRPSVLNDCILSEKPCVDMLATIAPACFFWKTASDIVIERDQVQRELSKKLRSGTLKDRFGKKINNHYDLLAALKDEEALLKNALAQIPWYYRPYCVLYNIWNYWPLTVFTFLHYSRSIAMLPLWVKGPLNKAASWYMKTQYPQIKEETKKIVKKRTFWLFHWLVESSVERTFNKIQNKAEKNSYIHDYSPYYHKLQYDFDLEVKNIYTELIRLIERNKALQDSIAR